MTARYGRPQGLPVSYPTAPLFSDRKQRRGSSLALPLSLLANAVLLVAMVYRASSGGAPAAGLHPGAGVQQGGAEEAVLDVLHHNAKALASDLSSRLHLLEAGGKGSAGAPGTPPFWLTVGIPTVPRAKAGTNYLTRTLESLMDELPKDPTDPLYGRIRVLVMNNAPTQGHPEFEELKARAAAGLPGDRFAAKAPLYIDFLDNPGTVRDPNPDLPDPDDLNNPGDRPGRQVRKQTCDLLELLRHAAPLSTYYMFMEDDFDVCPHMLLGLRYALSKANTLPHLADWLALRLSYGMNGLLLRNVDLPALADFLWENVAALPPDLLWVDFLLRQARRRTVAERRQPAPHTSREDQALPYGGRRPMVVYKYNLLSHLGTVSSFDVRPDRAAWPACYQPLARVWSLQVHERFLLRCRHDDLSPCLFRDQITREYLSQLEQWVTLPLDIAVALNGTAPPLFSLMEKYERIKVLRAAAAAKQQGLAAQGSGGAAGSAPLVHEHEELFREAEDAWEEGSGGEAGTVGGGVGAGGSLEGQGGIGGSGSLSGEGEGGASGLLQEEDRGSTL